jgi:curved DNA-binding protein CbpA
MDVIRAHRLLGVERGASHQEVRSAYRRQLAKHHSDAGGVDDPAAIAEIRRAYRAVVVRGAAPGVEVERPRRLVDVYA